MRYIAILVSVFALSCARKALDLQANPHLTASRDPTSLGSIDEQVGPIAVDAERLYWLGSQGGYTDGGGASLRSCKKQACAESVVTYDADEAEPSANFGVENGQIYWAHFLGTDNVGRPSWSLSACPVSGCAGAPRAVVADVSDVYSVAYASDAIYLGGYRVALSGDAPPLALDATITDYGRLGVHENYLYWVDNQSALPGMETLHRILTNGTGTAETLANGVELSPYGSVNVANRYFASEFAFDSSYIYWSQGTLSGAIVRCPLTGCPGAPEIIVSPVRTPLTIVVDGSQLYFLHDSASHGFQISSCTIGDCAAPKLIASGLDSTNALAVDDQYVYTASTGATLDPSIEWTNPSANIRRFPK